jgi:hypothetical protein
MIVTKISLTAKLPIVAVPQSETEDKSASLHREVYESSAKTGE